MSGSVLTDEQDICLTEDTKVFGDGGLCKITVVGNLLDDVRRARGELAEDPNPLWVGKGSTDQGQVLVGHVRRRR
jgi:hypothetical protein